MCWREERIRTEHEERSICLNCLEKQPLGGQFCLRKRKVDCMVPGKHQRKQKATRAKCLEAKIRGMVVAREGFAIKLKMKWF